MLDVDSFRARFEHIERGKIDEWDASSMASYRGQFDGERCFIIGNGPSLNRTEVALLSTEYTFGVNGIFYLTEQCGYSPTFYVVEDNHVYEDNLERIWALEALKKFFPAQYRPIVPSTPDVQFMNVDWQWYWGSSEHYHQPRFSHDLSQVIYTGQTVTYLNLQLAAYLGFSDIYLVGVDMDYAVPADAPVEGLSITSISADDNHFHPDYFGAGKKWHYPQLDRVAQSMGFAQMQAEESDFTIHNATIGGKLEAFPRVDYYSLFPGAFELPDPNTPPVFATSRLLTVTARKGAGATIAWAPSAPEEAPELLPLFDREVDIGRGILRRVDELSSSDRPFALLVGFSDEAEPNRLDNADHVIAVGASDIERVADQLCMAVTGEFNAVWSRGMLERTRAHQFVTYPRLDAGLLSHANAAVDGPMTGLANVDRSGRPLAYDVSDPSIDVPSLISRALERGCAVAALGGYVFVHSRWASMAAPAQDVLGF